MKKQYKYVLKSIKDIIKKHPDEVKTGTIYAASTLTTIGVGTSIHASVTNKKALAIRDEALSMYNESYEQAEQVLKRVGEWKIRIIKSFEEFIQLMERIQERPEGLIKEASMEELNTFTINDLKNLTIAMEQALSGAGGAIAGIGLGIAAFGLDPLVLTSGIVFSSAALCFKGISLSKKAIKNKRQALELFWQVENIVDYHTRLHDAAWKLESSMIDTYFLYLDYYRNLETRITDGKAWETYTNEDKQKIKNMILLVGLLNKICQVNLVYKPLFEGDLEIVNTDDVEQLVAQAEEAKLQCKLS